MFSTKLKVPLQKATFSLSNAQIVEDIEAISGLEEECCKLFLCLDDKRPQDKTFAEMNNFLTGAEKLQERQHILGDKVEQLQSLANGLSTSLHEIQGKIKTLQ